MKRSSPLLLLALALAPATSSCARCSGSSPQATTSAPSAPSSASSSAGPETGRCTPLGAPATFGGGKDEHVDSGEGAPLPFGAEIGGAAADASGFYVGVRSYGLLGPANVVRISLDGGPITVLSTFLPAEGAARAPLLATDEAGGRYVGALSVFDKKYLFRISRLGDDGALKTLAEIEEEEDESEANTLVATPTRVAVSWDDADPKHEHGRIHLQSMPKEGTLSPKDKPKGKETEKPTDVRSPESSDASWPVLTRAPDSSKRGVLLWLSERPETSDPGDGGAGEPSQAEAFRWVEAVVVDLETGATLGSPRVLSSTDGHAQTFAATWTTSGLVVVIRDDRRPTDGDGGELIAVHAQVDGSAIGEGARATIVKEDVAPGTPAIVPRPGGAFVAYLAASGDTLFVPAFGPGAPSREPALRGRRVVAVRDDRILGSRLLGSGLELMVAKCAL